MKDFSVVIPNLHSPSIDSTINSLQDQKYDHDRYEVIVVGMDKYDLVRENRMVHFDRSEQQLSAAQARNRGAQQAVGDVIIFMDADCVANPNLLENYHDRFQNAAIDIVGGGVEFSTRNYWTLSDNLSMFHDYMASLPAGKKRQLPSLNLAVRRSIFMNAGGFDERYPYPSGEDADLTIRLQKLGYQLYFEPKARVFHNPQRNSLQDLCIHAYYQGMFSTKVDPRYIEAEGLPKIFRNRYGLILGAPVLGIATTIKIFLFQPKVRRYWFTFPAILLAKIAWCIGAAHKKPLQSQHAQ